MNQNLQNFSKPLKVSNGDAVYCPYVKAENIFKNVSGVPSPKTLTGAPVDTICLPNLSDRDPPAGFGKTVCMENSPHYISFYGKPGNCYSEPTCTQKIKNCLDPF